VIWLLDSVPCLVDWLTDVTSLVVKVTRAACRTRWESHDQAEQSSTVKGMQLFYHWCLLYFALRFLHRDTSRKNGSGRRSLQYVVNKNISNRAGLYSATPARVGVRGHRPYLPTSTSKATMYREKNNLEIDTKLRSSSQYNWEQASPEKILTPWSIPLNIERVSCYSTAIAGNNNRCTTQ
jgi:hypothetical protein